MSRIETLHHSFIWFRNSPSNKSEALSSTFAFVQVRDVKIKVLTGLPTSTDEERAEFDQLAAELKVRYGNW
jgi:hypothetical protein